jgi:hypothetical protein
VQFYIFFLTNKSLIARLCYIYAYICAFKMHERLIFQAKGLYQARLENYEKNARSWAKHGQATSPYPEYSLEDKASSLISLYHGFQLLYSLFEFYVATMGATSPRACTTHKGALMSPRLMKASRESMVTQSIYSKLMFLICLSSSDVPIQELHWKAQEEKKTKVSSCLE